MIKKLVGELEIYQLTKAEALMMLNLRPRELGLLDCVIEECDLRFDEGQQERVLEIVGEVLAEGGEEGEEEGEGEKEGA